MSSHLLCVWSRIPSWKSSRPCSRKKLPRKIWQKILWTVFGRAGRHWCDQS
jgi:hypothetical protein